MIVSQSSAQPTASCSSGTVTGTKRIVASKGLRCRRGPAKISAGSEAPPPEENPTGRKYSLLLPASMVWFVLLAGYLTVCVGCLLAPSANHMMNGGHDKISHPHSGKTSSQPSRFSNRAPPRKSLG